MKIFQSKQLIVFLNKLGDSNKDVRVSSLRALRAKNSLTDQSALRATCQSALQAHVLTFQHALGLLPHMAFVTS